MGRRRTAKKKKHRTRRKKETTTTTMRRKYRKNGEKKQRKNGGSNKVGIDRRWVFIASVLATEQNKQHDRGSWMSARARERAAK